MTTQSVLKSVLGKGKGPLSQLKGVGPGIAARVFQELDLKKARTICLTGGPARV